MSLKLLGGILIVFCGYETGASMLHRQQQRLESLRQLSRFLTRISDEIKYRELPLEDVLNLLREENFSLLDLENCSGIREMNLPDLIPDTQKRMLEPVLRTLGQRTSQESIRQLQYGQAICERLIREEETKLCSAEKLYRQLGICGGLLAVLLFL